LLVFIPDHSINYREYSQTHPLRNKIPMIWAGGAVKAPKDIPVLCNQTDLAATLLGQLHLPHDNFRWSRDVLSASYTYPFAIHTFNHGFSLIDSTGFVVYDLEAQRFSTVESTQPQHLERMGKAILQATTADLKSLESSH
jgi:phosphoglycerol transferase MdoB-like AlkP superfamily enzyme